MSDENRIVALITDMKESLERELHEFRAEMNQRFDQVDARFDRMETAVNQNTNRVMSASYLRCRSTSQRHRTASRCHAVTLSRCHAVTLSRIDARIRQLESDVPS